MVASRCLFELWMGEWSLLQHAKEPPAAGELGGKPRESVPQRLKPDGKGEQYGTAEAVPLSKTHVDKVRCESASRKSLVYGTASAVP